MSNANYELLEKISSVKNIMMARATGGGDASHLEYLELRQEVLKNPLTQSRVPSFVRTCRTLDEFWGFIKPKFAHYSERRLFLLNEFDAVLSYLESASKTPADEATTKGLEESAAEYIQRAWFKALTRRDEDPEGAITAARTLLETTCKHLLEELGEKYDDKMDLPKLYGMTASKLNLAPSQHTEQIFKQILGGCHSIVDGLGALRNRLSDAHGQGKVAAKPQPRHAHLAVNLAGTMSLFLAETWKSKSATSK
jgi:hypothetical protein